MKCKHDYEIVEYGMYNCITQCKNCGKASRLISDIDPEQILAAFMLFGIVIGTLLAVLDAIFKWEWITKFMNL